jgi:ABC-type multidrug transport system ATPase subunit
VIDGLLDSLDPPIREKLWEHLLWLRRERDKSFVVFTSSASVAELCGRLAVIHKGRMVFVGRPDDFRRLGGEDLIVLGDLTSPALRKRVEERLSVVIKEEEGFLSFRVANGEKMVSDLLAEFGSDVDCVYLKRPTLHDALDVLAANSPAVAVTTLSTEH